MPKKSIPRRGSLQFWPRKRANKFLPSVNWRAINKKNNKKGFLGFICYKAGMLSAYVKDLTPDSLTENKRIIIPITILECPPIKILSIRFYKNNKPVKEILADKIDKNVRKKLKLPKNTKKDVKKYLSEIKKEDYDDIRVIIYNNVKKTKLKKKPDLIEISVGGENIEEKLNIVKEKLDKEITFSEIFNNEELIDIRGLTTGKGLQGPVKRFGIGLKDHKSEKGRRRPGSLGPWHPAYVTFRTPMAGQLGMFSRIVYNNKILSIGNNSDEEIKNKELKKYGKINTEYLIVRGSVQGPVKRQLLVTPSLRANKKQTKKKFEILELR